MPQRWIHYIGGLDQTSGNLTVIRIGISTNPRESLVELFPTSPFHLILLGYERGTYDLLEKRRAYFNPALIQNDWYHPKEELVEHIDSLPAVDIGKWKPRKFCIDLSPEDWLLLEAAAEEFGAITKTRFVRNAITFYMRLSAYRARGFCLEANQPGVRVVFSDLDNLFHPDHIAKISTS